MALSIEFNMDGSAPSVVFTYDKPFPKSGIYCIRNRYNKKFYVGSSADIKTRWAVHRHHLRKGTHGNTHLQRSWNKYGEKGFEFFVLQYCPVGELLEHEQWEIDNTSAHYNLRRIANSNEGYKHRQETIEKQRKRCGTEEYRETTRQRSLELWSDPEHKGRMTALSVERWADPDYKADLSKKLSDARRANMAKYHYEGRDWSPIELSEHYGVDYMALRKRLQAGWSVERAVTQPVTRKPRKK